MLVAERIQLMMGMVENAMSTCLKEQAFHYKNCMQGRMQLSFVEDLYSYYAAFSFKDRSLYFVLQQSLLFSTSMNF